MPKTILLLAGAAAPLIYFALVAGAQFLMPGFDHATRYLSELGTADAPHPEVFNYAIMAAGGLTVAGAAGLFMGFRERSGGWLPSALAAIAIALFGASLVLGGLYPMPDERHMAWGLGFAVQAAPLLALWALWPSRGHPGLKALLVVNFIAANVLLAVMFGVGELVTRENVGLWQRAYSATMFPWLAVMCLALIGRPAQSRSLGQRAEASLA